MNSVYIKKIGIVAPGLENWKIAESVLSGQQQYVYRDLDKINPEIMPKSLLRRTTQHVRLAIEAASQILPDNIDELSVSCVFASSENDGDTTHEICTEVMSEEPGVSPMRFHNSVSNAAVGNFCIALNKQMPSTSICAYDSSFAMGLVESVSQLRAGYDDVLLVSHDMPCDEPLHSLRPLYTEFAVGLHLTTRKENNLLPELNISFDKKSEESCLSNIELELIRKGNPAATSLPLLEVLAQNRKASVNIPLSEFRQLTITVT